MLNPLTVTIWGSRYKVCAKWRRYPGARLERYLQNGAVIRMPGFFCLEIEEIYFFSYDIFGFAINRIYKKTIQYVYLGFSVGVKVVEKLFFVGENQKTLRVIVGKNCAMPSMAAKEPFRDVLLNLVGINFRISGISIDPGNSRR